MILLIEYAAQMPIRVAKFCSKFMKTRAVTAIFFDVLGCTHGKHRLCVRYSHTGGKFRAADQTGAKACFLSLCCRVIVRTVFFFRQPCTADRSAINSGRSDADKEAAVEAAIFCFEGRIQCFILFACDGTTPFITFLQSKFIIAGNNNENKPFSDIDIGQSVRPKRYRYRKNPQGKTG